MFVEMVDLANEKYLTLPFHNVGGQLQQQSEPVSGTNKHSKLKIFDSVTRRDYRIGLAQ